MSTRHNDGKGRIAGKVAIITGAARGQGEAQARMFVAEGANVVIADVLDEPGRAVVAELGDRARFSHLDVSDEAGWDATIAETLEMFGTIDILVNGAGVNHTGLMEDTTVDDFLRMVHINQLGPWLGMRAVMAPMRDAGGGSIVNVISASVIVQLVGKSAYAGSKGGMRAITQIAARELGRFHIRVNAVLPGGVATPMTKEFWPTNEEYDARFGDQPIPRIGQADEVARAVLFLASDEASYCAGTELLVDGGLTAAPLRSPLEQHDASWAGRPS